MTNNKNELQFWDHVEDLRKYFIRSILVFVLFSIIAFLCKDILFNSIILYPSENDFITFRILCNIGQFLNIDSICLESVSLSLINIQLGGQLRFHLIISLFAGFILAFPFIIWQLWIFVKPALFENELRATKGVILYISLLFFLGVVFGYFIITPITISFLANYQLSDNISNTITIGSYISSVSMLTIFMGLLFEMPLLILFLTKVGMISSYSLKKYRKHTIVLLFVLAGFITPADVFSQLLVGIPLLLLYEVGIILSKKVERKSIE
jgi:sec-independent protein translocase protein TatC